MRALSTALSVVVGSTARPSRAGVPRRGVGRRGYRAAKAREHVRVEQRARRRARAAHAAQRLRGAPRERAALGLEVVRAPAADGRAVAVALAALVVAVLGEHLLDDVVLEPAQRARDAAEVRPHDVGGERLEQRREQVGREDERVADLVAAAAAREDGLALRPQPVVALLLEHDAHGRAHGRGSAAQSPCAAPAPRRRPRPRRRRPRRHRPRPRR